MTNKKITSLNGANYLLGFLTDFFFTCTDKQTMEEFSTDQKKQLSEMKLLVAIVDSQSPNSECAKNVMKMYVGTNNFGIKTEWTFASPERFNAVSTYKDCIITNFFTKSDATHLLFWSNNVSFDMSEFVRILLNYDDSTVVFACPPTDMKLDVSNLENIAEMHKNDIFKITSADMISCIASTYDFALDINNDGTIEVRNGSLPVKYCVSDCVLLSRNAVNTFYKSVDECKVKNVTMTVDNLHCFFTPFISDGVLLTEHQAFCKRANRANIPLRIDICMKLTTTHAQQLTGRVADTLEFNVNKARHMNTKQLEIQKNVAAQKENDLQDLMKRLQES